MFFYLSKILGFFALPSNTLIVLGLVGVAIAVLRGGRAGGKLIVASLIMLAIFGLSPEKSCTPVSATSNSIWPPCTSRTCCWPRPAP